MKKPENRKKRARRPLWAGCVLTLCLLLAACGQAAEPMDQEIAVEVALPDQGALTLESRFIGTVSSGEDVSIMPLVSGEITGVYVELGDKVTAGQQLAQIDDTSARLQLESASAGYNSAVAAAQQTTGASWDMQTMSTEASIAQLEDAVNNYQQQIDGAQEAMDKLSAQIGDLRAQRQELESQSGQLSDGVSQAQQAMTAAQTKYYTALAMRSQMEPYGVTDEIGLSILSLVDPEAAAAFTQALTAQGLTMADISDSGIALLKSAYDDSAAAYESLTANTAAVASGLSSIDSAIAQCESGIDQYQTAIQQYLAAQRTYEQNLALAKESAVLTETQLKDETQAVLNAQINAAGVGVASARQALEYYRLSSPIDGVITAVNVQQYGLASPGYPAFTVSNQDSMTVTISVSQSVRDSLRAGDAVTVEGNGQTFRGAIVEIAYTASAYSGLFPVKISVAGARNQLLTGTSVSVTAHTYSSQPGALLVPYDAVYYDDNQAYVFCVVDGTAQRRDVTVGLYSDTTAAITSGLMALDQVITTWSPRLREGVPVRPVNEVSLPTLEEDGSSAESGGDTGDNGAAAGTDAAGSASGENSAAGGTEAADSGSPADGQ
ncbi:MAG: efflux RND transporter periplasmic adaptor subunit [Firmicutes bacterium]|nr:efflux RND transporter periplasmic adaptor subunit [Bacillota bacterium]